MTQQITIEVSDVQMKALQYVAVSVQDWADNALHNRARVSTVEIIQKLTDHCNANSIQIAVGEDAQVLQAFELGVVQTAAERSEGS